MDFGLEGIPKLVVDEDPPAGKNGGPDPSRLLAASIAHCRLSSLLFCLEKSRAKVNDLSSSVKVRFGRDENKRLRVISIDSVIEADVPESERTKFERCVPLYEQFCTVSESVKKGIPITTEVRLKTGRKGG